MTLKEPAPASRANGATTGFADFGAVPLDTRGASPPVILLRHRVIAEPQGREPGDVSVSFRTERSGNGSRRRSR